MWQQKSQLSTDTEVFLFKAMPCSFAEFAREKLTLTTFQFINYLPYARNNCLSYILKCSYAHEKFREPFKPGYLVILFPRDLAVDH